MEIIPQKSYLLPSEHDAWKTYCSRFSSGIPHESKELDVEEFRSLFKLYHDLVDKNDPSLDDIQPGEFVVVHPTRGILCHGTWDDLEDRDEEHEFVFQHKPEKKHLFICKTAGSVEAPLSYAEASSGQLCWIIHCFSIISLNGW